MTTLVDISLGQNPWQPAIVVPDGASLSHGQLQHYARRLSNYLRFEVGVAVGSGVAFSLVNSLEFCLLFFGVTNARMIALPLNPRYKYEEVTFFLKDQQPRVLVVARGEGQTAKNAARDLDILVLELEYSATGLKLWREEKQVRLEDVKWEEWDAQPQDVALVLHTSGTTGRPKGVPLTHGNITTSVANIAATYRLSPADKTLLVMPLFHVHGLIGALLSSLFSGSLIILPVKFSVSGHWDLIRRFEVTWYTAVPSIHAMLLSASNIPKCPTLRFIRSCSSSLAPMHQKELEKRTGVPVLEAYAMTEAAHQICSNPLPPAPRYAGMVGMPQGVNVKIFNERGEVVNGEGEICINGKNVTQGYCNPSNDESFQAKHFWVKDGQKWLRTGDLGWFSKEGYLKLSGRIKEMINRAGEKIAPLELDEVILALPGVKEAVCFGVPDAVYGEEVGVAISTSDHTIGQKLSLKGVAEFKWPKYVWLLDQLPKTDTGKVQRSKVAQHCLSLGLAKAQVLAKASTRRVNKL